MSACGSLANLRSEGAEQTRTVRVLQTLLPAAMFRSSAADDELPPVFEGKRDALMREAPAEAPPLSSVQPPDRGGLSNAEAERLMRELADAGERVEAAARPPEVTDETRPETEPEPKPETEPETESAPEPPEGGQGRE